MSLVVLLFVAPPSYLLPCVASRNNVAMSLLPFHADIVRAVLREPRRLTVIARGLSLHIIVARLLCHYATQRKCTLVFGADDDELAYYVAELQAHAVHVGGAPRAAADGTGAAAALGVARSLAGASPGERQAAYEEEGGVLFADANVAAMDMLKSRLQVRVRAFVAHTPCSTEFSHTRHFHSLTLSRSPSHTHTLHASHTRLSVSSCCTQSAFVRHPTRHLSCESERRVCRCPRACLYSHSLSHVRDVCADMYAVRAKTLRTSKLSQMPPRL